VHWEGAVAEFSIVAGGAGSLQLTTDKQAYEVGETVTITLTNTGTDAIEYGPYSIKDPSENVVYAPVWTMEVKVLEAGKSESFTWDQKDDNGDQVPEGYYSVHLEGLSVPFTIGTFIAYDGGEKLVHIIYPLYTSLREMWVADYISAHLPEGYVKADPNNNADDASIAIVVGHPDHNEKARELNEITMPEWGWETHWFSADRIKVYDNAGSGKEPYSGVVGTIDHEGVHYIVIYGKKLAGTIAAARVFLSDPIQYLESNKVVYSENKAIYDYLLEVTNPNPESASNADVTYALTRVPEDTDNDGLADTEEDLNANRLHDSGETNLYVWDTDNDGLSDGVEHNNIAEWTYMLYLSADSEDIHPEAVYDINSMKYIGSSEELNILILFDGSERGDSRAFYVTSDHGESIIPMGDLHPSFSGFTEFNMGDPLVAESFIKYCIQNYPAEHYAITFWGHAGGGGGFACDHGDHHDKITIAEMNGIFTNIKNILGRNVDLVTVDSCWVGTLEFYCELSPFADYAIASEKTMVGAPYYTNVNFLSTNPGTTPRELAVKWVRNYNSRHSWSWDSQDRINVVAGVDLSRVDALTASMSALASALKLSDQEIIAAIRAESQRCDTDNYRDLYHFAKLLAQSQEPSLGALKELASAVMVKIDEAIIPEDYTHPGEYNGISIYFPREAHSGYFTYHYEEYKQMRFSLLTEWDEFLDVFIMGGIPLELGVPKTGVFQIPPNGGSVKHCYAIGTHNYQGDSPLVIQITFEEPSDAERLQITLSVSIGTCDYYHAEWQDISDAIIVKPNGRFEIPGETLEGEHELRIGVCCSGGNPGENIGYSITATIGGQ
jgi:hypothetical protein